MKLGSVQSICGFNLVLSFMVLSNIRIKSKYNLFPIPLAFQANERLPKFVDIDCFS